MKLNLSFSVTVETRKYKIGDKTDPGENTDLDITLNVFEASLFLFRIGKPSFEYQNYKILILPNQSTGELKSIIFNTETHSYIVRSPQSFMIDVLAGYEKIRMLEKLAAIADYAEYSTAPEEEILDEFDDNIDV